VTADCDTIYSMRKSIWFILAAVLVLAACGSQEPDLAQDTRSSAVEAPSAVATIPIPEPTPANTSTPVPTPTNVPAPPPPPAIFMPPQLPAAAFLPIPTKPPTPQPATTASAPTPAAGPEKPTLSEDRTIYAPEPIDVPARLSNTGDRRKHARSDARNPGGGGVETYPTLDSCTNLGIRDAGHRSRRRYRTVRDGIHSCYRQNTGAGRVDSPCPK